MSIIRLKDNHSMRVSLRYPAPRESISKNGGGMEYCYTLTKGDVMFLPAMAHEEIQALRPSAGEAFTLSRIVSKGNAVTWTVERIQTETPGPKPMARAIVAAAPVPIPPSLTTRESIRIFNQLVATIQAVNAAEAFAKTVGREVCFDNADIRSMAISGFIEQSRRAA